MPDDYSLLDASQIAWQQMLGHRQITDAYLLGLALRHQCRFVTFDARIDPGIVIGATSEYWVRL